MAQAQREPLVLNNTVSAGNSPRRCRYRVLSLLAALARRAHASACWRCCATRAAEPFTERDAHIAEILARKAIGVIESSFDALTGLYTRPAFEQRVRGVVADLKAPATGARCTSTSTSCTSSTRTSACTWATRCWRSSAS